MTFLIQNWTGKPCQECCPICSGCSGCLQILFHWLDPGPRPSANNLVQHPDSWIFREVSSSVDRETGQEPDCRSPLSLLVIVREGFLSRIFGAILSDGPSIHLYTAPYLSFPTSLQLPRLHRNSWLPSGSWPPHCSLRSRYIWTKKNRHRDSYMPRAAMALTQQVINTLASTSF